MHPSAVQKLHLADDTVIDDLQNVREISHRLQRPGIASELVYAVDVSNILNHVALYEFANDWSNLQWVEGDLAVFNNHGVLHSVTGSFLPEEVRIFRQYNVAASEPPLGPVEIAA